MTGERRPAIVCGGRDYRGSWTAARWLLLELHRHDADALYHGDCRGADLWAAGVVRRRLPQLRVRPFPADWSVGKQAGPLRNYAMAVEAASHGRIPVLLAFPGADGTANMVAVARRRGIEVVTYEEVKT